jgi:hypothetical protein
VNLNRDNPEPREKNTSSVEPILELQAINLGSDPQCSPPLKEKEHGKINLFIVLAKTGKRKILNLTPPCL